MHRQLIVLLFLFVSLNIFSFLYFSNFHPATLGATITAPVTVTASIPFCPYIIITPENRIPSTHNNALEIVVDIRPENTSTPIFSTTINTDSEGRAQLCPLPPTIIAGQHYDVLVKGLSHLRRIFPHQLFGGSGFTLDLRTPVLYAGDANPSSDNFVNAMDYSYEINNIYKSGLRADLNRDSLVNSLEFPTLISHLYKNGDN